MTHPHNFRIVPQKINVSSIPNQQYKANPFNKFEAQVPFITPSLSIYLFYCKHTSCTCTIKIKKKITQLYNKRPFNIQALQKILNKQLI